MTRALILFVLSFSVLAIACGDDDTAVDTGTAEDTGSGEDTGTSEDTGGTDTGEADTGEADTGEADTGEGDSGEADTGMADTGTPDTGMVDTGTPDTGPVGPGECSDSCTPTCLRAFTCVKECGGPVMNCGCCTCAPGSIDSIGCPADS